MATPTTEELLAQYRDKIVPYTFNGGFVCLSYGISLVGTGTTLELIRRRTSHRGVHNLLLLVGAAIAMGGIAIWSMHFIGNRAIYMLNGQEPFQIAYSTPPTVMSLLVPILVLILAFLGITGNRSIRWWQIGIAGLLSGAAICGMHYLADASISNYNRSYQLSYLIGSVVIAVLASTTALALFFVFESTWSNAWWKKLGCAMVLAGAVSGMHWCAASGTSYRLIHSPGKGISRQDAMVVVICLAIAAGIVMTSLAVYSSWVRRDYASKSQQVVLAAGVFDEKGRIMVSQDGYLPSEVVTDTYLPKSNDDVFNTSHPLFHWMFRASHNWDTISKAMAKMANHISVLAQDRNNNGRAGVKLVGEDGELVDDYDTILRELFCLTADALASKTKETLTNVGTLWDEIFISGDASKNKDPRRKGMHSLAEKGFQQHRLQEYGRGCLMFLVRNVSSKKEVERLEASGFRFAEVHQVVGSIRSTMHIKTPDLETRLRNMAHQRAKTTMMTPGVHVGMFAVRARLDRGGFDVYAQRSAKNLLPSVPLPMDRLEPGHAVFLNSLRGMTMANVLAKLDNLVHTEPQEQLFISHLRNAVSSLRDYLGDEGFDNATLLPKEVHLPCSGNQEVKSISKCTLVAFRLILPIHANVFSSQCSFTPLNFFKIRQLTYEGSSHHVEFSHMVHRDMSSAAHELPSNKLSSSPHPTSNKYLSRAMNKVRNNMPGHIRNGAAAAAVLQRTRSQEQLSRADSRPDSLCNSDVGSFDDSRKLSEASQSSNGKGVESPAPYKSQSPGKQSKQSHLFGGIMVSQEVSINVQQTQNGQQHDNPPEQMGSELVTFRPRPETYKKHHYTATATGEISSAGQGNQPEAAFIDELLALTMQADKRAAL